MPKVKIVRSIAYPNGQAEAHVILDREMVWIRLVNKANQKPLCHWSTMLTQGNENLTSIEDALSMIKEFDLFQSVEANSRNNIPGWNTWTFGTPGPILDFLDSFDYKEQVKELRD